MSRIERGHQRLGGLFHSLLALGNRVASLGPNADHFNDEEPAINWRESE